MFQVLPVRDQVIMQVEHFQVAQLRKALTIGQSLDLVKAQINFLEGLEVPQVLLHVKQLYAVVLQVCYHQVHTL
jgi:hypothetical protein